MAIRADTRDNPSGTSRRRKKIRERHKSYN
jgi:hypothetical protein